MRLYDSASAAANSSGGCDSSEGAAIGARRRPNNAITTYSILEKGRDLDLLPDENCNTDRIQSQYIVWEVPRIEGRWDQDVEGFIRAAKAKLLATKGVDDELFINAPAE